MAMRNLPAPRTADSEGHESRRRTEGLGDAGDEGGQPTYHERRGRLALGWFGGVPEWPVRRRGANIMIGKKPVASRSRVEPSTP